MEFNSGFKGLNIQFVTRSNDTLPGF